MNSICVQCGKTIDVTSIEREKACVLVGPEGAIFFCVSHIESGPQSQEYHDTIEKVTLAKIAQLQNQ